MLDGDHFRINPQQIVFEIFEGEVLAINLETGTYYSLTGLSCELWLLMRDGVALNDIINRFAARYEGSPETIEAAVRNFLVRLRDECLIVEMKASESPSPAVAPLSSDLPRTPLAPFEMKVFTDMQDLLLLDPIHDVEDAGWPIADAPHTNPASE